MRQRLERKISFVFLFVYFCHPHFWFYSFRIFPSASAIRRYPVHVLQTPLCTLWDKCYKCVCVPNLFCRSLCDQFTLHSRASITCIRPGTLCGDLICVCLTIVCTLCGDLICVCVPILSCRGLCGQLTFHSRVFMTWPMTCLSPGTLCGDLICVCVTSLCTLWFASMWQI